MIEYYDVSGCYILRPWSYAIWERIRGTALRKQELFFFTADSREIDYMYLDLGFGHFVFVFFFSVIVAILTERCNYNNYCSFD